MKKRTLIVLIIAYAMFEILVFGMMINMHEVGRRTIRYNDIDHYIEDTYDSLNFSPIYYIVSKDSKKFIPEYSTFEYKQFAKKFYIFENTDATNLVLELQFDTVSEYENFLAYEHNRCEYTDEFDVEYHGYKCYVTTDSEYTFVWKGEKVPTLFGMLCENQEDLTVRYLYYYSRGDLRVWFFRVFRQTNCDW